MANSLVDYEALLSELAALKTKNEELTLKNEELTLKNEELTSKNEELTSKNEEQSTLIRRLQKCLIPESVNVCFDENATAEDEGSLAEPYSDFVCCVRYDHKVDSMQSLNCQWNIKERYDELNNKQVLIFQHFLQMYEASKDFSVDKGSDFYYMSWAHWLKVFVALSESIAEIVPGGCWLVRKDVYRNGSGKRAAMHCGDQKAQFTLLMSRTVCVLKYGSLAIKDRHVSHLCNTPDCVNPAHLFPESATVNCQERPKCFALGSAKSCECIPQCIFVRKGVCLPCRNDPNLSDCECEFNANCFEEVIGEKSRLMARDTLRKRSFNSDKEPLFNPIPINEAEWTQDNRLKIEGKAMSKCEDYEGKYALWKCAIRVKGNIRCGARAYSDSRYFFKLSEHRC